MSTSSIEHRNQNNIILIIEILWMLLTPSIANIVVVNKLNRRTYMKVEHDLLLSGSDEPLQKVQLYFVHLPSTCSIPKIPPSKLYSLNVRKERRPTILVIQEHNDECDVRESILKTKSTGYTGVIFCVDKVERFQYIKPVIGFYTSVILNNKLEKISNLDASRYKISIFRDTTPLQIFYEYVSIAFRWFMRLIRSDFIVSGIQAFLLLTPILVIVGAHYFNARRQEGGFKSNLNREYESDEVHEESVASDIEDETLEYRRILNVGPDASPQDVVRAFRQMALVLHPDKNVDLSEEDRLRREEEFKKCHSAKTALLKAILESGTQVS